ncbi:MAG: hypothetical protein AB7Q17_07190 [Phycisphaerae bacterium]
MHSSAGRAFASERRARARAPLRGFAGLLVGDVVESIARGRVAGGADHAAERHNGVMPFLHDVNIHTGGALRVTGVDARGAFAFRIPRLFSG